MEFLIEGGFWVQFGLAFTGMIVHFLKKKVKGESFTAITGYFKDNLKSTIIAVITTLVGVAAYYTQMATNSNADLLAVFMIGYSVDSALNKWETK